ncbi:MAG TPA: glycosyltransferase [Flavisolibacter sp.]|jgi:glycosyltransferase involved in cell wall biosynthesis|nr:glycosyltransferase [Flavisolibacter sp.]
MKVLHCLRNFFPDPAGGTEVYVLALCQALRNKGIEVAVVKPAFSKQPSTYSYHGIRVVEYFETSVPTPALKAGLVPPAGLDAFEEVIQNEGPDLIHFHETTGSTGITIFHVQRAARLFPVITTFHLPGNICQNDDFLYKGRYACDGIINTYKCAVCSLQKKGLRWGAPEMIALLGSVRKAKPVIKGPGKILNYPVYVQMHKDKLATVDKSSHMVFVLSQWYRDLLVKNGFTEQKIRVLPPSISTHPFEQKPRMKFTEKERPVRFVFIGRVSALKGLHVVLQAFARLSRPNWQLDIYGPVSDQNYYQSCLQLAGENPGINWYGEIPHCKLLDKLCGYDALLFPSVAQETAGLVMLEAMAAGIPVIGSSIWSVLERIEHGKNGLIFRRGDAADLRQVIGQVLDDPSLLDHLARNLQPPPSIAETIETILSAYHSVCESGSETKAGIQSKGITPSKNN